MLAVLRMLNESSVLAGEAVEVCYERRGKNFAGAKSVAGSVPAVKAV